MNITECKNCGHAMLSTAHICTKCGTVKVRGMSRNLVWLCAATWLAIAGVILGGALL